MPAAQRVGPAVHPLPGGVVLAADRRAEQDAVRPAELAGDDADPPVPEVDEVLRGGPAPAAVVDVDARAGHGVLVDETSGRRAAEQPVRRGRAGAGVDQRAVHGHVPAGTMRRRACEVEQEGERQPGGRQLVGDRPHERRWPPRR